MKIDFLCKKSCKQQLADSGFALLEVIVFASVLSFSFLAISNMVLSQNKEIKSMYEKMLGLEVKQRIQNVLSNSNFCGCLFRGKTFDTTNLSNAFTPALSSIPMGFSQPLPVPPSPCTSDPTKIVEVGHLIAGSTLGVSSIGLIDLVDQGGGIYSGNIEVGFDLATLTRAIRPVLVPVIFKVDLGAGVASSRPFLSCVSDSVSSSGSVVFSQVGAVAYGTAPNSKNPLPSISASVDVQAGDKLVFFVSVYANSPPGSNTDVCVHLEKDGSSFANSVGSLQSGWANTFSWTFTDNNPAPGLRTYSLFTGDGYSAGSWSGNASLLIFKTQ